MTDRSVPFGVFNFIVNMPTDRDAESALGGFSEVSGLNTEITISEYRSGNDKLNHVSKVPGLFKTGDVTLKRGVLNSSDFWAWIEQARRTGPAAKREVSITLRDENRTPIMRWLLRGVTPMKYTAPSLNAKGGQDVAVEELVLSAEIVLFESLT
jgi:phage tail-like protein